MSVADYTGMVRGNYFTRRYRSIEKNVTATDTFIPPLVDICATLSVAEKQVRLQRTQLLKETVICGSKNIETYIVRRQSQLAKLLYLVERVEYLKSIKDQWMIMEFKLQFPKIKVNS